MECHSQEGPDRGWSWVIAFAACFNSFVLAGIIRASGVLFVEFIREFGLIREEASWPVFLCLSVLNLIGLLTGALGHRFGTRRISMIGSLIATIGISSCYLTTSFRVITILFGVVFGVGYGLANTLLPVIVNEYFLNYRAMANGIANSGSCFGSMLLPSLFEYLIDKFQLSGCFLITGGIVFNTAVSGALMRPPLWLQRSNYESSIDADCKNSVDEDRMPKLHCLKTNEYDAVIKSIERKNSQVKPLVEKHSSTEQNENMSTEDEICRSIEDLKDSLYTLQKVFKKTTRHSIEESCKSLSEVTNFETKDDIDKPMKKESSQVNGMLKYSIQNYENKSFSELTNENSNLLGTHGIQKNSSRIQRTDIDTDKSLNFFDYSKEKSASSRMSIPNKATVQHYTEYPLNEIDFKLPQGTLNSFKQVLTCPMFYITTITNASFYTLFFIFVVIIKDFLLDSGIPEENTKYLLFAFGISDLLGRLCLGWITDRKFLRRSHFVMGCMSLIGLTFFSFPFATSYVWFIIITCFYGLLQGCTMVVFYVLLVDYVGLERQAVAMGCLCFFNGIVSLARPFLVGYFRDNKGSYSYIFYLLGGIGLVSSFLWLLERFLVKTKQINPEIQHT